VLTRQRFIEVRFGARVSLRDHFRTDLHRRLVQPATREIDAADLRSTSSPIEYDGAYATASSFFSKTAGLAEPPSIRNGMR